MKTNAGLPQDVGFGMALPFFNLKITESMLIELIKALLANWSKMFYRENG